MPRSVELAQAVMPVVGAVALVLVATRQKLVRRLRNAGATDEAAAIALNGRFLGRWWTGRLLQAGVLGESADGHHWLDEEAWRQYRATRRRWALTIVLLHVLGLALVLGVRALGEP